MSLVQQQLAEKALLVTGLTGFVGKLLVLKLLQACPEIKCIYVLMRRGKYPSVQDRLLHTLESKVFEKLKEDRADFAEKIVPINGDLLELNLGLSAADNALLVANVSVVFHLAQLSHCDCHLRAAIEVNVHGLKKLMHLAQKMKQLTSFVFLSSVYSNCNHATIGEVVYQPSLHPQKLLNASEWVSDDVFEDIEQFLTKGHANAYTYSMALAEYMLQEEFGGMPVSIVRHPVIGATWREPFPGWIESNNGIVPLLHACGRGLLRVIKGNPKSTAEIIPADLLVNAIIAVSWYQSTITTSRSPSLFVYNLISNAQRRLTWMQLEQIACYSFTKNPLVDVIRIPQATMTSYSWVFGAKSFLYHTLHSYTMDVIGVLLGRSPSYVASNKKFMQLLLAAQYFTCRDWKVENENVKSLMSKLSALDKKTFSFDASSAHWPSYIESFCMGVKKYVAREPLDGLNTARTAIQRMTWVNRLWNVLLILSFIRVASNHVEWARKIWNVILFLITYVYAKLPKIVKA